MSCKIFPWEVICLSLLFAIPSTYGASTDPILFDNGNHASSGNESSDSVESAGSFRLTQGAEITGVTWKGVYERLGTPLGDDFVIRIYNNRNVFGQGNLPTLPPKTSAIFTQEIGQANRTATGETFPSGYPQNPNIVYGYSASIDPFYAATGTTYWLEIYNQSTNNTWFWSGDRFGLQYPSAYFISDGRFSEWIVPDTIFTFQLNGVVSVPEPSTVILFALGAIGLLIGRRL
jgi:hypothetical protein